MRCKQTFKNKRRCSDDDLPSVPRQHQAEGFEKIAKKKGLLEPGLKAGQIVAWLKQDFELGHSQPSQRDDRQPEFLRTLRAWRCRGETSGLCEVSESNHLGNISRLHQDNCVVKRRLLRNRRADHLNKCSNTERLPACRNFG